MAPNGKYMYKIFCQAQEHVKHPSLQRIREKKTSEVNNVNLKEIFWMLSKSSPLPFILFSSSFSFLISSCSCATLPIVSSLTTARLRIILARRAKLRVDNVSPKHFAAMLTFAMMNVFELPPGHRKDTKEEKEKAHGWEDREHRKMRLHPPSRLQYRRP